MTTDERDDSELEDEWEHKGWMDEDEDSLCPHWGDPCECEEMCICGHQCRQHSTYTEHCCVAYCDCKGFEEPD